MLLEKLYDRALHLSDQCLLTDACFIFTPSQLALTAYCIAAKELDIDFISLFAYSTLALIPCHPRYLLPKYQIPSGEIIKISPSNSSQSQICRLKETVAEAERCLLNFERPTQDIAKEIDRRLFDWRNPLTDPESQLFQQQQRLHLLSQHSKKSHRVLDGRDGAPPSLFSPVKKIK